MFDRRFGVGLFFVEVKTPGPDLQAKLAITKLIHLRGQGRALLYLPNFCMAETSKAIAKISYGSSKDHDAA